VSASTQAKPSPVNVRKVCGSIAGITMRPVIVSAPSAISSSASVSRWRCEPVRVIVLTRSPTTSRGTGRGPAGGIETHQAPVQERGLRHEVVGRPKRPPVEVQADGRQRGVRASPVLVRLIAYRHPVTGETGVSPFVPGNLLRQRSRGIDPPLHVAC
jgi:hypothetical protein